MTHNQGAYISHISTWTKEIRYEGYGEMKGNRSYIPLYLHFLYTFYWFTSVHLLK